MLATTHYDAPRASRYDHGDPPYARTLYTTIAMFCMCLLSVMAGAVTLTHTALINQMLTV